MADDTAAPIATCKNAFNRPVKRGLDCIFWRVAWFSHQKVPQTIPAANSRPLFVPVFAPAAFESSLI